MREKADAKEREIREHYNLMLNRPIPARIRQSEALMEREEYRNSMLRIKYKQDIEFSRLEILEPILDPAEKQRLQSLRNAKEQERVREQEREQRRSEEERRKLEKEREEELIRLQRERKKERCLQKHIHTLEGKITAQHFLPENEWIEVAQFTKNQTIIDVCKNKKNKVVLGALLINNALKYEDLNLVTKKIESIRKQEEQKRKEQEKQELEEYRRQEDIKTFLRWFFGIAAIGGMIAVIVFWGKWILGGIFIIFLLISVFSSN